MMLNQQSGDPSAFLNKRCNVRKVYNVVKAKLHARKLGASVCGGISLKLMLPDFVQFMRYGCFLTIYIAVVLDQKNATVKQSLDNAFDTYFVQGFQEFCVLCIS